MATLSQGKVITCVTKEKVELLPLEPDALPLKTGEIRARTLVSLVSSGTEVVGCYSATHYQLSYGLSRRRPAAVSGFAAWQGGGTNGHV